MKREITPPGYVLVLDDDVGIRELVEAVLFEEGYEVVSARDTDAALRLVQERPATLIFFDLALAHGSGESFVSAYRALPDATASMVVLSGAPNLQETAARLGADGYLTKPFDLDDLLAAVKAAIP